MAIYRTVYISAAPGVNIPSGQDHVTVTGPGSSYFTQAPSQVDVTIQGDGSMGITPTEVTAPDANGTFTVYLNSSVPNSSFYVMYKIW